MLHKIKLKLWVILENAFYVVLQSLTILGCVVIAIGMTKLYEFIWMIVSYFISKIYFKSSYLYHTSSYLKCTIATWITFGVCCAICPTTEVFLTFPAILGCMAAYYMSDDMQEENKKDGG